MPCRVWDEITHPFPNFNGYTFEVSDWINNFISHYMMDVITTGPRSRSTKQRNVHLVVIPCQYGSFFWPSSIVTEVLLGKFPIWKIQLSAHARRPASSCDPQRSLLNELHDNAGPRYIAVKCKVILNAIRRGKGENVFRLWTHRRHPVPRT